MNSFADVWASVLSQLKKDLSETTFSAWFDELEAVEMRANTFVLHCPNPFKKSCIENLYMNNIKSALRNLFSMDFEVQILDNETLAALTGSSNRKQSDRFTSDEFTFDTFVVGPSNKLAYAASQAVAEHPAQNYNPLLIYGDSGLGKTHLIYAIANVIRRNDSGAKIAYVKGDDFTNELVDAIREGKTAEMREKYRQADLLLVDDIQFIAGKKQTQEEFFHTFNTLYENHRQIVLTSDRPPSELLRLEDRLKTRFEWGLIADINPPDYETRMAIIQNKSKTLGMDMPIEVCSYIAENITTNIRQIEGTVKKIKAYWELTGMEINVPNVSRAIKDMYKGNSDTLPTPNLIISEVARFHNLTEEAIRGTQRNKGTAEARQIAMYLTRKMTNLSLPDIGKEFNRDHATVIHGIRKVETALADAKNPLNDTIKDITANINNKL